MNRFKPILVMLTGMMVKAFAWLLARADSAVQRLKPPGETMSIVEGPISYGPSDEDEPSLVISSSLAETPDANEPSPAAVTEVSAAAEAPTEIVYGSDFVDQPEEETSTDFIYRKTNPVDLSGLTVRPEIAASAPSAENPPPVPAWEVQISGETLGPFTRQEILEGLNDGAFPNDIKVRELPSQEWLGAVVLIVSKIEDEAA